MNSVSEQIAQTDEQIARAFNALSPGLGDDIVAGDWDVTVTHDSLAEFAAQWGGERLTAAGQPALVARRVQRARGEPRTDMYVVDFGDVRAAVLI